MRFFAWQLKSLKCAQVGKCQTAMQSPWKRFRQHEVDMRGAFGLLDFGTTEGDGGGREVQKHDSIYLALDYLIGDHMS